jgi:hypothetical protein
MQISGIRPCRTAAAVFRPDRAVGLAEMFAPFAVAKFDEVEIAIPEHDWRDLTGPGAGIVPMHVLGADLDAGCRKDLLDLADGCEGRDDETLDAQIARCVGLASAVGKGHRLSQRLVHLPAGSNPGGCFRHAVSSAVLPLIF